MVVDNIKDLKEKYPNLFFKDYIGDGKGCYVTDNKDETWWDNNKIASFNYDGYLTRFNYENAENNELFLDLLNMSTMFDKMKSNTKYVINIGRYNNKYWVWNKRTKHIDSINLKEFDENNKDFVKKYVLNYQEYKKFKSSIKTNYKGLNINFRPYKLHNQITKEFEYEK